MNYLAGQAPDDELIDSWVEQFHRDGCLFLRDVLPPDWCAELRRDLDLAPRGDCCRTTWRLVAPDCHVIHNNSFRSPSGGGLTSWHQDDAPHFEITHGEPPDNVRLPVLPFTCNYYLTDVETVENGPTQTVPHSHLFGARPPDPIEGSDYADQVVSNVGPAGSVIMFNNQVWHRGAPNTSQRTRYITQISYARRLVGHKYFPFMNYQMPEHVYAAADERRRRLLGFLPRGAYG